MKIQKILKTLLPYGVIYLILMAVFLGLLIGSAALPPTRKYGKLMNRSARILKTNGPYFHSAGITMDNHTDALILNVACSLDQKHPVRAALSSLCHHEGEEKDDGTIALQHLVNNRRSEMHVYPYWRYWFGQSAVMKILHYVWHLNKIYALFGVITLFLTVAGYCCVLRDGHLPALALLSLMALCNFQVFFQSLQYPPVFWIGLGGLILLCRNDKLSLRGPVFFMLGMLTAYFDLLTVPVLAFGIPALFICGKDTLSAEKSGSVSWKSWLKIWCGYPIVWLSGYILSWGTKILLGILTCGTFRQAFHQILLRSGAVYRDHPISRWQALIRNVDVLSTNSQLFLYGLLLFIGGYLILNLVRLKKRRVVFNRPLFLGFLFLALLPPAVILLMANHTYIHAYMTYRGLALSLAALLMMQTAFRPKGDMTAP